MKKIVIGQPKKKQRPNTRKVLELNVESPDSPGPISVNDKGQRVATDFAQLSDLNMYKTIRMDFESILKQKSKSAVIKKLVQIINDLPKLCKEYDEIGFGTYTRQVKRSIIPSMQELYQDMLANKIKPSVFLTRIENIQDLYNRLNPAVNQKSSKRSSKEDIFSPVKDIFSNVRDVHVALSSKNPALVAKVPVSIFLRRRLSDSCRALLEKHFGAKFAPYTGAALLTETNFLVINKLRFDTPDMQSVTSSMLSALFRGQSVVPIHQIAKDSEAFYAVLVINHSFIRVIQELVDSTKSMEIHVTTSDK